MGPNVNIYVVQHRIPDDQPLTSLTELSRLHSEAGTGHWPNT
jgi:hypothetical protein